ncbi:MAG: pyridoxamine 5'-phosphate oxidase family protein, partial [Deltaproteobacteria bacterium]|nr:pyridoxamine 5'-phosphate oxidase family protein [Deltaproteobacteria bacterium]
MPPERLLTAADQEAFAAERKMAFVATVDAAGLPHVALITTLRAAGPDRLLFGEFIRGRTKAHLAARPEAAWAVLTLDRRLWRGRARWIGTATSGPDYDLLNALPMFRYNAYFGIHTVHHLELVDATPGAPLPMARVVPAVLVTRLLRAVAEDRDGPRVMSPFTEGLLNRLGAVKLLAWVDGEGWPRLIPLLQCQAAGS